MLAASLAVRLLTLRWQMLLLTHLRALRKLCSRQHLPGQTQQQPALRLQQQKQQSALRLQQQQQSALRLQQQQQQQCPKPLRRLPSRLLRLRHAM
jgi:hypothetical protein